MKEIVHRLLLVGQTLGWGILGYTTEDPLPPNSQWKFKITFPPYWLTLAKKLWERNVNRNGFRRILENSIQPVYFLYRDLKSHFRSWILEKLYICKTMRKRVRKRENRKERCNGRAKSAPSSLAFPATHHPLNNIHWHTSMSMLGQTLSLSTISLVSQSMKANAYNKKIAFVDLAFPRMRLTTDPS